MSIDKQNVFVLDNKTYGKYFLDKAFQKPQKYVALQGPMAKYVKAILYTMNDLFGEQNLVDSYERILNTNIKVRKLKIPEFIGMVTLSSQIVKDGKFFEPSNSYLQLSNGGKISDEEMNQALKYFFVGSELEKDIKDIVDDNTKPNFNNQWDTITTLIHELVHIASPIEKRIIKDGMIMPSAENNKISTQDQVALFRGGLFTQAIKVNSKGKLVKDEVGTTHLTFVHEGTTEMITMLIACSTQFRNRINEMGIKLPEELQQAYVEYLPIVRLTDMFLNNYLVKSHFEGIKYVENHRHAADIVRNISDGYVQKTILFENAIKRYAGNDNANERQSCMLEIKATMEDLSQQINTICQVFNDVKQSLQRQNKWTKIQDMEYRLNLNDLLDYDYTWKGSLPYDVLDKTDFSNNLSMMRRKYLSKTPIQPLTK